MTVGIILLLLINKEQVRKRFVSFGVAQITAQEFEHQRRHLTRIEINKLKASKEYAHLLSQKGPMLEKWNWQSKESSSGKKQKAKGDQLEMPDSIDCDLLQKQFDRIDDEIILGEENLLKMFNQKSGTPLSKKVLIVCPNT